MHKARPSLCLLGEKSGLDMIKKRDAGWLSIAVALLLITASSLLRLTEP